MKSLSFLATLTLIGLVSSSIASFISQCAPESFLNMTCPPLELPRLFSPKNYLSFLVYGYLMGDTAHIPQINRNFQLALLESQEQKVRLSIHDAKELFVFCFETNECKRILYSIDTITPLKGKKIIMDYMDNKGFFDKNEIERLLKLKGIEVQLIRTGVPTGELKKQLSDKFAWSFCSVFNPFYQKNGKAENYFRQPLEEISKIPMDPGKSSLFFDGSFFFPFFYAEHKLFRGICSSLSLARFDFIKREHIFDSQYSFFPKIADANDFLHTTLTAYIANELKDPLSRAEIYLTKDIPSPEYPSKKTIKSFSNVFTDSLSSVSFDLFASSYSKTNLKLWEHRIYKNPKEAEKALHFPRLKPANGQTGADLIIGCVWNHQKYLRGLKITFETALKTQNNSTHLVVLVPPSELASISSLFPQIQFFRTINETTNISKRFMEIRHFLFESSFSYDRVIVTDLIDIFFQSDLFHLMPQNGDQFLYVNDLFPVLNIVSKIQSSQDSYNLNSEFTEEYGHLPLLGIKNTGRVNVGTIAGDIDSIVRLCFFMVERTMDQKVFDQSAINFYSYIHPQTFGISLIPNGFLFLKMGASTSQTNLKGCNGILYDKHSNKLHHEDQKGYAGLVHQYDIMLKKGVPECIEVWRQYVIRNRIFDHTFREIGGMKDYRDYKGI